MLQAIQNRKRICLETCCKPWIGGWCTLENEHFEARNGGRCFKWISGFWWRVISGSFLRFVFRGLPSGQLAWHWKIPIFYKIHLQMGPFSMATCMLVYRRFQSSSWVKSMVHKSPRVVLDPFQVALFLMAYIYIDGDPLLHPLGAHPPSRCVFQRKSVDPHRCLKC